MKYYAIEVEGPRGEKFLEGRNYASRYWANYFRSEKAKNAAGGFVFRVVERDKYIAELTEENERRKSELDRINDAVVHARHAHRHESTADLAREMVTEKGPVTREMVAGWSARVVDLGVFGSETVSRLKRRIEQQRIVARSYCKYIARLEAALKHVLECKTLDMDQQENDDMPAYTVIVKCHNAVRAAQRTFNGKKKERINEDK